MNLPYEEAEAFLLQNQKLIHSIAHQYKGRGEHEELFQEASIGFFKGICSFHPSKGDRLVYCTSCARNEVRWYIRKSKALCRTALLVSLEQKVDDDSDSLLNLEETSETFRSVTQGMEEQISDRIFYQEAMEFLKTMPPEQQLLVHRFLEGVPQSKISAELHLSQSTVSRRLRAALNQIASHFDQN